jgi:hypothetical protein
VSWGWEQGRRGEGVTFQNRAKSERSLVCGHWTSKNFFLLFFLFVAGVLLFSSLFWLKKQDFLQPGDFDQSGNTKRKELKIN